MDNALAYAQTHFDDFVNELEDLLRIPSISTDPTYQDDVQRAARWLADHFQELGTGHVEIVETGGHPIVFAEHHVDDALPTVLVYGHYDVQPPDPLELWNSPPFEPVRKEGILYGRGTCDDKGQLFMHLKALESYLKTEGQPPVNLKFLFEGEEESGSKHLPPFIADYKDRLAANVVLISDTTIFASGVPSITYGLRGLAYVEVTLTGPNRDLHSGIYGGAIENPINVLSRLIAGLHDEDYRITISGFYDDVRDLTEDERATYRQLPFDKEEWIQSVGVRAAYAEKGYSALEAISARPTLDVNGIWGGYQGQGAKTVLPSQASAKISMRLVPNQRSEDITEKIKRYFEAHTPPTMQLTFEDLHGGKPVIVNTDSPAMQAAAEAMERVYGKTPFFTRDGGSIPIVADFKEILGLDSVLMGFGLDSDAIHSPNEHFGLDRFQEGIQSIIYFLDAYPRYLTPG
ncbi:MAG: dipeptidase [Rhodothermales bacterium]